MQNHQGHRFNDIGRLRSPERLARLEVERVVDLALAGKPIQSVLDIGTGTAVFAEAFAQQGKSIIGIDVNPAMLDAARQYVPAGDFRQSEAEAIPFPNRSVDLAFMGLVLHETDNLLQALQEAHRMTRLRLAILEWPYAEQEFGPGLQERLQTNHVMELARQAGFTAGEIIQLAQLVLYRFDA